MNCYTETVENLIEQCAIRATELNSTQQSLLMNLLYNMYMHAQHGEIVKKESYNLSKQLTDIHNSFDPEKIHNAMPQVVKTTAIIEHAASEQKKHFTIWQILDRHISERDAQISTIIVGIQKCGQMLVESYIEQNSDIETLLLNKKNHLEKNAQSNYTIAQTFELLRAHPEKFSSAKELENISRIDVLHKLNTSIEANAHQLSEINRDISDYINSIQFMAINAVGVIYEKIYMHLKAKDGNNNLLIITFSDNRQALQESDIPLPYSLKNR